MIAIIDYDAGNLKSVEKALIALGEEVIVSRDPSEILQADKVILPGVGSFGDAMNNLDRFGLVDTIKNVVAKDTPFLEYALDFSFYSRKAKRHQELKVLTFFQERYLKFQLRKALRYHIWAGIP